MTKYKIRAHQTIEHIYYITAEDDITAEGCEEDHSLDDSQESDLKERRWNKDVQ